MSCKICCLIGEERGKGEENENFWFVEEKKNGGRKKDSGLKGKNREVLEKKNIGSREKDKA